MQDAMCKRWIVSSEEWTFWLVFGVWIAKLMLGAK